jgi:hypothetical protein
MILHMEAQMMLTRSLLGITPILGSAVTLKAGIYCTVGLPDSIFVTDVAVL